MKKDLVLTTGSFLFCWVLWYTDLMEKKLLLNRLLLTALILFFVALPIIIHAQAPEVAETTTSWWDEFKAPFSNFGDTLKALGLLVANVGTIIALLTTGVLPVIGIAAGITYGAMAVLSLIAAGLFEAARGIILSTLDIPVIPGPGAVSVVQEGWRFSRDIVSLFFVVILAFIGLTTILRLENFQLKKTLPAFIIMAVLLNFSGLVVGFMVDMGNLATAVFIQPIRGVDILKGPLEDAATDLLETVKTIPIGLMQDDPLTFVITTLFTPILNAGAKAIFYGALILMGLIVPLLFILRIGILWILTILAPFAFAAYILPQTRNCWSQWWKQLIQWSFIGVPMGFFLLLAMKIASIETVIPIGLSGAGGNWFENLLVGVIQPLFVLLFLVVGFSLSITLVPAVAATVMKNAEKGGTAAVKVLGKSSASWAGRAAKSPIEAYKSGRQAWDIHRGLGHDWKRSAGAAIERAGAAARLQTTGELTPGAMASAARRGITNALKNAGKTGLIAGRLMERPKRRKTGKPAKPEDMEQDIEDMKQDIEDMKQKK
ncbi:MAG: hypothetical protein ABH841_02740 [Candidatus Nealsonbacteria bacterium]